MKSIRQLGWDFVHNHRAFAADILGPLFLLPLKWSEWYQDCVEIYSRLDVKGRHVLDLGSDFGTTPMFFIGKGAKEVIGFSLEEAYYMHRNYTHYVVDKIPDSGDDINDILMCTHYTRNDVLKIDAEGLEWTIYPSTISYFHDWIIALHKPILNPELYEWIKENGELIATKGTEEFAVYQKRKTI